ncbi:MAG: polyprenyl synthetase family protein [Clostridia bacterium]|nr:polyprenyl synthetase family protein [Clostridia bacterium]
MDIKQTINQYAAVINYRLTQLMENDSPKLLNESMSYSLYAGGKRLRPVMNLMAALLVSDSYKQNLDLACAIEMIHTYSLIHDDLPALDNDTLRRGKPTNHTVFGEAQAILAGDGLLNYAYEIMLKNALKYKDNLERHVRAIKEVANRAGVEGMIGGQVQDVYLAGKIYKEKDVLYIHSHKTADMMIGSLLSGLMVYTDDEKLIKALEKYAYNVGMVFQIIDDVLDITAGAELGKTRGKDVEEGKATFPAIYGLERSVEIAREKTEEAKDALSVFGDKKEDLCEVADYMLNRMK